MDVEDEEDKLWLEVARSCPRMVGQGTEVIESKVLKKSGGLGHRPERKCWPVGGGPFPICTRRCEDGSE